MFGAKSQFLSTLLVASLLLLIAQPVLASETEKGMVSLTGSVYDNSGLPLIGALIAVALPGSDKPEPRCLHVDGTELRAHQRGCSRDHCAARPATSSAIAFAAAGGLNAFERDSV